MRSELKNGHSLGTIKFAEFLLMMVFKYVCEFFDALRSKRWSLIPSLEYGVDLVTLRNFQGSL